MIKRYILALVLCGFGCVSHAAEEEFHILSCTRPLSEKVVFEHCYVKLVQGNRILDGTVAKR